MLAVAIARTLAGLESRNGCPTRERFDPLAPNDSQGAIHMKKIISAIVGVIILTSIVGAASAQASPIRECGNMYVDGIQNITTRNVSCSDARSFANKVSYLSHWYSGSISLPGWHTYSIHYRTYYGNGWQVDARATRINHVIHFQIGPYGVSDGGPYGGYGKCAGIPVGQPCY
jgi:hypothetical protein